ncbi:MAG: ABC transporter ATP-binding protein [Saprospiraceae bacterium]|jgi:ABC-2 type transport system ATP-binding protein|nr:ABC transporter ATP-binding protein [Saprospiraceae bacterium]MBP8094644.1 ABC transporter ATP-binding protein [Saprospiraceae bacterium]
MKAYWPFKVVQSYFWMMEHVIETSALTKRFGSLTAIDEISMHVRQGEIYGFLGLNGAGKTTLIRALLGMIKPSQGTIKLFGHQVKQASRIWNDIGYMVETPASYPNLTVVENLQVYHTLRGLKEPRAIDQIVDTLELTAYRSVQAKYLSLGNNQRLGLAKALLHHPRLLILDEPINGLDPAGIVKIREYLGKLAKEEGATIFLSSHILSEIAKLATRIGIVHQGRLIHEINTEDLPQLVHKTLYIDTLDNDRAYEVLVKQGLKVSKAKAGPLICKDKRGLDQPELLSEDLFKAGLAVRSFHIVQEDLESFFLRMIQPLPHTNQA